MGKTLSYHWLGMDTGTGSKLWLQFNGSQRMACDTTKYIGDRASL